MAKLVTFKLPIYLAETRFHWQTCYFNFSNGKEKEETRKFLDSSFSENRKTIFGLKDREHLEAKERKG